MNQRFHCDDCPHPSICCYGCIADLEDIAQARRKGFALMCVPWVAAAILLVLSYYYL